MIAVADVMKLPSMYGATILAGHAGISNPVESVTGSDDPEYLYPEV